MDKTIYRTYGAIKYQITILDIKDYVFLRVKPPDLLTPELREQIQKDLGYKNYLALDFGIDEKGYGIWELQRIKK